MARVPKLPRPTKEQRRLERLEKRTAIWMLVVFAIILWVVFAFILDNAFTRPEQKPFIFGRIFAAMLFSLPMIAFLVLVGWFRLAMMGFRERLVRRRKLRQAAALGLKKMGR